MMGRIKRFFGKEAGNSSRSGGQGTMHDPRVAACALFLEMSAIDGEFGDRENELILAALRRQYGLPEEDAAELVEVAAQERKGSVDLWQFTNLINENYTMEEKLRVIETVWKIAYADGFLNKHEDYLVHKLAELLRLTHQQLIEAKLRVKAH